MKGLDKKIDEFFIKALTRISQYDLAYRMQDSVPDLTNLKQEPEYVRDMYGDNLFGKHCLQARRLVQQGVRCVELFNSSWDILLAFRSPLSFSGL